eukprot:2767043-Lingulodinium_polyedra.AAC.1
MHDRVGMRARLCRICGVHTSSFLHSCTPASACRRLAARHQYHACAACLMHTHACYAQSYVLRVRVVSVAFAHVFTQHASRVAMMSSMPLTLSSRRQTHARSMQAWIVPPIAGVPRRTRVAHH